MRPRISGHPELPAVLLECHSLLYEPRETGSTREGFGIAGESCEEAGKGLAALRVLHVLCAARGREVEFSTSADIFRKNRGRELPEESCCRLPCTSAVEGKNCLVVFVFCNFGGGRYDCGGGNHRNENQRYEKVMHEEPFSPSPRRTALNRSASNLTKALLEIFSNVTVHLFRKRVQ